VGVSYPVYTQEELEGKKADMLSKFKASDDMKHLSEEDMIKTIDVFYKMEIKYGEIIIAER